MGYVWQNWIAELKSIKKGNNIFKYILFVIYIFIVIYLTLLNRHPEPERMAWLTLFGSYKRAWEEQHEFILWGLIDNVLMMVPLGILLPWINRKCKGIHVIIISFILSIAIECTQYLTRLGYFDVDDIWNNLWGCWIGYGIFTNLRELIEAFRRCRKVNRILFVGNMIPLVVFVLFFLLFLQIGFGKK